MYSTLTRDNQEIFHILLFSGICPQVWAGGKACAAITFSSGVDALHPSAASESDSRYSYDARLLSTLGSHGTNDERRNLLHDMQLSP